MEEVVSYVQEGLPSNVCNYFAGVEGAVESVAFAGSAFAEALAEVGTILDSLIGVKGIDVGRTGIS